MPIKSLRIAMFSIHSSPVGKLGTRDTGGMSVYIRAVARELGQMGHAVDIYTCRSNGVGEAVVSLGENVDLIQLGNRSGHRMSPQTLYRQLPYLLCELDSFRSRYSIDYDLIHSHYWLSGSLGQMAQERWKRPHMLTFHTLAAVKDSIGIGEPEPALRLATEKQLARECHHILSTSEREKRQLSRFYGAAREKVILVSCGVDLSLFRPMDSFIARQKLEYPCEDAILLYVGRFEPLKGIDRLLEAAAILIPQRNIRVVLVGGDGPRTIEEKRLRGVVRDLGLQNHVIFAGRVEQHRMALYYSAADVLVVPSYSESFGLVALESLACGTPVVSTPVGAIENIIIEGRNGHVVDNADSQSLAAGIERLLVSSEIGRSTTARDEIRATVRHRSWSTVAASLLQEYMNICIPGGRT